jgi:hypothetical protein
MESKVIKTRPRQETGRNQPFLDMKKIDTAR